jgi:hypothetical protein
MIESVLGSAFVLPPIRPVAVVATAVAKIVWQLFIKLESGRRVDDTVSRFVAQAVICSLDAAGGAWNRVAVCYACKAATVLFGSASGAARARSSHLLPALRLATTIAVKGYCLFGTSSNNRGPARSGKTPAGVQSASAGRPRRTGAM